MEIPNNMCSIFAQNFKIQPVKARINKYSDAVLADMLKELISDGMVERIQYNEIPPRVEYLLTEKGKSVLPILQSICDWSKKNLLINLKENYLPAKAVIS